MIVLDSSFLLTRLLGDPRLSYVHQIMSITREPFRAPVLLSFEIAHVLSRRFRLGRLTLGERDAALRLFEAQLIDFDERPTSETLLRVLDLAQRHGLSGYDATYLELALRLGAELATLDHDLATAGRSAGVVVHHTPTP